MIRTFAGYFVMVTALSLAAQESTPKEGAVSSVQPKVLSGVRGVSVKSAVVSFTDLAAEKVKQKSPAIPKVRQRMPLPAGLHGTNQTDSIATAKGGGAIAQDGPNSPPPDT